MKRRRRRNPIKRGTKVYAVYLPGVTHPMTGKPWASRLFSRKAPADRYAKRMGGRVVLEYPGVHTNPPELRKVHAGLESAYLASIARKDATSRKLAKKIKGPWMAVEKLLKRGAVPRGNPRRRSSRKVAYSVKRGGRRVGHIVASSKAAALAEAHRAGLTLGARLKHVRSNPPHGATLSTRAESITYKHQDDGEWYRHRFSPGVVVRVAPDRKSVRLYRPDGKPLAGNFDV